MWRWADVREDVDMSRCEDEQMWEKMWTWADVKMSRCERRCGHEQMWRWADVREDVDMSRCEDEQMWEKMWRWADVKMSRCEDEQMWEKMWTWADVKMSRCERRCEDEQMWEKMWRWADAKMRRCWEDVKMSRCEDEQMWEKMWRWADVKMRRCEDEKMLRRRCEDEKMFYRPPLLEEPCAQTLSGKIYHEPIHHLLMRGYFFGRKTFSSNLCFTCTGKIVDRGFISDFLKSAGTVWVGEIMEYPVSPRYPFLWDTTSNSPTFDPFRREILRQYCIKNWSCNYNCCYVYVLKPSSNHSNGYGSKVNIKIAGKWMFIPQNGINNENI